MEVVYPHPMHVVAFLGVWFVAAGMATEICYAVFGAIARCFDTLRFIHLARLERGRTLDLERALTEGDPNGISYLGRHPYRPGLYRRRRGTGAHEEL